MAEEFDLELNALAHGGAAIGRDARGRVVFVPLAIPGEKVRVRVVQDRGRFAQAELLAVLQASPDRVDPRCPHFGPCGGCHLQHMSYERQLSLKGQVVADQLARLGGLTPDQVAAALRPVWANPEPWAYRIEVTLSPTADGGLGYWSPAERQVIAIRHCPILRPALLELWQDLDLDLPGLRWLRLWLGEAGDRLMALAVNQVEPPSLRADFPVSAAMVLPDGTAANLIGHNFVTQVLHGRTFRVSAGGRFPPGLGAAELMITAVLEQAGLTGTESVLELYSGLGALSAFLAQRAAALTGVEANPDAIADAAVNLDDLDNVTLYQAEPEELLSQLDLRSEVIVVSPPARGLPPEVLDMLLALAPARLVIVSDDVAVLARDARRLNAGAYRPVAVQPIDMLPQHYQILTVSLWEPAG